MFGSRRHRPPSQPLTAATANPNAATAAASAFGRQPSRSLSSAAAAAALRARPHTPTNVAEVQTKRTMRRSASVSSAGSRDTGGGLKRSPSAGSMSERSLRSSSPRRPAVRNPAEEAPPVPSIPDHAVPKSNGDARSGNKRRTVSLNIPSLRQGSGAAKEGHTSWFGPGTTDPAALHNSDARPRSSGSSINFSYPRGTRVASPTTGDTPIDKPAPTPTPRHAPTRPSTTGSAQDLVYDPNSRRMVSRSELEALEQSMKEPRRKPTRRKKQRGSAPSSDSGTGTVSKPEGAVAGAGKPVETFTPFEAPELVTGRMYEDMGAEVFMEPRAEPRESRRPGPVPEANVSAIPDTYRGGAGATVFPPRRVPDQPRYEAYRPPTAAVHEAAERAENHRHAPSAQGIVPVVRSSMHTHNHPPVELPADHLQETSRARAQPPPRPPAQSSAEPDKAVGQYPKGASAGHHKTVSIATMGKLLVPVRHSPPPRSTSPIKSALKHSFGSTLSSSVSDHGSEASTDVAHQQVDPAVARKKSVRVSFDDESVVVGEAAGDNNAPESPQTAMKKRWYSLSKRRDSGSSLGDGDDRPAMKPRPVLPSFGSIREKKARNYEERPLVRPRALATSPPRSTPSASGLGGHGEEVSSDRAIGTALTEDLARKREADASRLQEPLPPQVTSVEGDGFMSDESSSGDSLLSSDDEEQQEPLALSGGDEVDSTPASTVLERDGTWAGPGAADTGHASDARSKLEPGIDSAVPSVPQISVSGPSSLPMEEDMVDSPASSEGDQFFDVPGTFSGNDADKEAPESDPGRSQASETPHEEVTAPQNSRGPSHDLPATIEEESEESGIFSDAYEDLSDVEGDGFQSLDAVADSPVRSKIPQKASGKAVASIAKEIGGATTTSGPAQVATDGAHDMGWEQAKAYWRSLSAEKRKELEREAMQDAGEEADLDDSRPAAKPRKKKLTKTEQSAPVEKEAPPTGPAKGADVEKPGRFLRKTLRGSHPAPSEDAAVTQPPPERGMLKSLRSPPPAAPSEAITEGGMRKSLRAPRPPDAPQTESPPAKDKSHPLQLPTPSLSLTQKLKARRTVSLGETPHGSTPPWRASPPQRRSSISSESSFRRATPRPEPTGFRKTLRSGSSSPGMVPGSSAGRMGSFSLRSSSPPRGPFRRGSSMGSSRSGSPAGKARTSLLADSSDGSPRRRRIFSFGRFSKGGKQKVEDPGEASDEDVFAEPASPTARRPAAANGSTASKATPASKRLQEEFEEPSDSDPECNHPAALVNGTHHPRSGRGVQPTPARSRKGSLMSALRGRKADQGRVARPERVESAARRDTRLERSAAELEAVWGEDGEDEGEAERETPRRRLEKRGGGELEGKRRFSALRRVFKMDD